MIDTTPENPKKQPSQPATVTERLETAQETDPQASLQILQALLHTKRERIEALKSMIPSDNAPTKEQYATVNEAVQRRLHLSLKITLE